MSGALCPKATCRGVLDIATDGNGRMVTRCIRCERRARRLCRDCPRRTVSLRCIWCPSCSRARKLEKDRVRDRARYALRREAVLADHRRRALVPEVREHRRQYMRAYRQGRPRDDIDRLVMRLYMQTRRADPAYHAKELQRRRDRRAQRKAA